MDAKVLVGFLIVLVLALSTAKKVLLPRVRLVGGRWKGEGRVEIFFPDKWGTVCDDNWDMNDARVVCRQLGFPDAVSAPGSAYFGAGNGQIWLDNVECSGKESSISDCRHKGWGVQNCDHSEDASVICSSIRLVGGSWKGEGRVEIFYKGNWGTVCDDNWDMNDARVVCRQLGYQSAASAPSGAYFGAGSGRIWLDDVFCSGSEISIADCPPRVWGKEECGHNEDASAICSSICKPGYIRDGRTGCSPNGLQDSIIAGYNINNLTPLNKWLSPVMRSVKSRWIRCWRASLDGWAAITFHSKCDGQGPTVTIVRVGKYIFGGYASAPWASHGGWKYDSKAFLFSLVNKPGWAPAKLPQTGKYSSRKRYSLYFGSSYGPTFGGGFDIHLTNYASSYQKSYSNLGHTYNEPPIGKSYNTYSARTFLAGSYYFKPDEIETFYETT